VVRLVWCGLVVLALASPSRAAERTPELGAAIVAAPAPEGASPEAPGALETGRLPLESRTSVTDTVARYFPGAILSADGSLRLRGGRGGDVAGFIDGVRTRHLVLPLGMVDQVTVEGAGYGAAFADAAGGLVDVRTRSGAALHVGVEGFQELHERSSSVVAPTVSGSIVRDELSYVIAARGELVRQDPQHDPEGLYPDPPRTTGRALAGGLKLTWTPQPGSRFDGLVLVDQNRRDNGGGFEVAPEAQPAYDSTGLLGSVRWTGTYRNGVVVRSHIAHLRDSSEEQPVLCRAAMANCDGVAPSLQLVPRTSLYSNWIRHAQDKGSAWELVNSVEVPLAGSPAVAHRLRATSRLRPGGVSSRQLIPGNRFVQWNTRTPEQQTEAFANDPRFEPVQLGWARSEASTFDSLHAVEDELRIGERLTVTPGLALVTSRVHGGDGLTINDAALLPGLALAWDATADGRTWVRASTHRRMGSDADGLARFVLGAPVTRNCRWNGTGNVFGRDCQFSGGQVGRTVGLGCGPDGVSADGAPCAGSPAAARFWEHTLGVTRVLAAGLTLAVDGSYRRAGGVPAIRETNRIWQATGAGSSGFRTERPQVVVDWSASDVSFTRAMVLTAALQKRAGALRALVSYTLGRLETETGDERDDRRHAVRALVSYDLAAFASLGVAYRLDSGLPAGTTAVQATTAIEDYRARAGINPGLAVGDPAAPAPGRGPAVQSLDLQLRGSGKRLTGVDMDLYLDVFNLLGTRRVTGSAALDSPDFGVLARAPDPRWIRLGAAYRF
jgi:hypothetical protein